MPCKHEGGTDLCERDLKGNCLIRHKQTKSEYAKQHMVRSGFGRVRNQTDVGEAGELFVAVDLLKRGLTVTKPLNRSVKDDLHVKCGDTWFSLQSKVAAVNRKTGTIIQNRVARRPITSDIIAWVDLAGSRIRYESNTKLPLPPELQE